VTYRPSIEERIAWTSGLRPTDMKVLQALAKFADFETGANAHPSLEKLVAWSELSRATVVRTLDRLETGGWIFATARRHRHPTTYRVCLERLATSSTKAKPAGRKPPVESQNEQQTPEVLSLTMNTLGLNLSSNDRSESQNETPPRLRSTPSQYPSAPALRAGLHDDEGTTSTTTEAKVEATDGTRDLWANGDDYSRRDPDESTRGLQQPTRSDQVSARDAGVHLPEPADPSGAVSHQPRGSPQQLTFGPIDATSAEDRRHSHWQRVKEIFQDALKKKSG
jgi:DNA-binding MarR family transcriptional regulator